MARTRRHGRRATDRHPIWGILHLLALGLVLVITLRHDAGEHTKTGLDGLDAVNAFLLSRLGAAVYVLLKG